jgi:hypothetical protein
MTVAWPISICGFVMPQNWCYPWSLHNASRFSSIRRCSITGFSS